MLISGSRVFNRLLVTLAFLTIGQNSLAQLTNHKILTMSGIREYKLYRPENLKTSAPTVVAIHGCKQTAETFAQGSKLYDAANKYGFNLLLPEQKKNSNPYNCWNWFLGLNQMRSGEPAIIMQSIQDAQSKFNINSRELYLLGMSSGAAMSNILMNCYPKSFKAVASHSGVPYAATTLPLMAQTVLERGMFISTYLTVQKGLLCGMYAKTKVPALVIQGAEDEVVPPIHAQDLTDQFTEYNSYSYQGLELEETSVERADGYNYTVEEWKDRSKRTIVKKVLIENLKHEWSGGDQSLPYNQSKGPDSTEMIIKFFKGFGL